MKIEWQISPSTAPRRLKNEITSFKSHEIKPSRRSIGHAIESGHHAHNGWVKCSCDWRDGRITSLLGSDHLADFPQPKRNHGHALSPEIHWYFHFRLGRFRRQLRPLLCQCRSSSVRNRHGGL